MAHFATITVLRRSQLVNSAFSSPRVARHQDIPAASFVFISTLDSEIPPHFTGGTSNGEASEPLPAAKTRLVGGRLSPSRFFRPRRRTDRCRRTRAPTRLFRAACRASPGPLPFEDRLALNRSRHLPR